MEKMRELFIEELTEVQGGASAGGPYTTMACCEEGPFDGCCWYGEAIKDLLRP